MRSYGYYIGNILLGVCYLGIRQYLPSLFDEDFSMVSSLEEVYSWEPQTTVMWLAIVAVRTFRSRSNEGALANFFFATKAVVFTLLFTADWRVSTLYLLLCYAVYLLFPPPFYDDTDKLVYLTPGNFEETVKASGNDTTWLVELYATFSLDCANFSRSMAQVADKYSSERLKFGKIDVGAWPSVAQQLGVEPQSQLPTLVLFEKGKEHSRLPRANQGQTQLTRSNVVSFFELEWRQTSSRMGLGTLASKNS